MTDKDDLNDKLSEMKMRRLELDEVLPQTSSPPDRPQPAPAPAPKFIAEHTVASGETLSHLSLKYYASAAKPYWMVIYEANKSLIGDNPNRLKSGLTLKIPELPSDLKK